MLAALLNKNKLLLRLHSPCFLPKVPRFFTTGFFGAVVITVWRH